MKSLKILVIIIGVLMLSSFSNSLIVDTFKIDPAASQLKWTGYHLAKSYNHWGYVKIKSGTLTANGNDIIGGQFVIDMTSISNADLKQEKENTKLVKHLKSDDFFNVKKFPEAKLVIKSVEKQGDQKYQATGDLTIRGITREIRFDINVTKASTSEIQAVADLRVVRTDFEVMYGWKLENAILDKEFRMEANIVARK